MSQAIVWNDGLIENPYQFAGWAVQTSLTTVTLVPPDIEDVYDLLLTVIEKLEALQACCYNNSKAVGILNKENTSVKRDLKLLIASTERMEKGRL